VIEFRPCALQEIQEGIFFLSLYAFHPKGALGYEVDSKGIIQYLLEIMQYLKLSNA